LRSDFRVRQIELVIEVTSGSDRSFVILALVITAGHTTVFGCLAMTKAGLA
jgi:hypothetical protein